MFAAAGGEEQEEEVETTVHVEERLKTVGISATDVKKLREEGIVTVGLVIITNKKARSTKAGRSS